LAVVLAAGACLDLPTSPEEARDRLAEGRTQTISLTLPLPTVELSIRDKIDDGTIDFGDVIDTDDFTIHVEPDPFVVTFDPFRLDVTDVAPIVESYALEVDTFDVDFDIQADPVPVDLPRYTASFPLPAVSGPASQTVSLDYSAEFTTVTMASGAEMRIEVNTDGGGTVTSVSAALLDGAGNTLASSVAPVSLAPLERDTLVIPVGGLALPSDLDVRLDVVSAVGDLDPDPDAGIDVFFPNATVTAATGVVGSLVSAVSVTQRVALDETGDDFSEATLATGTLSVTQFAFGDLIFTQGAAFETDLAGKSVGLTPPDSITVAGTVGPTGSGRVDINTAGSVGARITDITLASATLNDVDFDVDETADVLDEDDGDLMGVTSVEVATGSVTVDMFNRMPVTGSLTVTLAGATGPGGAPLSQAVNIIASADGTAVAQTLNFDLAGATIIPADLEATVTGNLTVTNGTVTAAIAADAFRVEPSATVTADAVTLNNAGDDLSIDFETTSEFTQDELGIEDITEFLADLSLNDVALTLTVQNPTGVALTLDSLVVTLISFPSENPIPGAGGGDVSVLVDEGCTESLVVPATSSKVVTVDASELVSKLLNELSVDQRAGIKVSGTVGVGGASGRISVSDELTVGLDIRAPFDLSLPPGGVTIEQTSHDVVDLAGDGADLISDLSDALVSATVEVEITNPLPIGLVLDVALAPTPPESQQDSFDPFAASPQLVILGVAVDAAPADANGRATGSTVQTVTVVVPTDQLTIFEEGELSLRVNATILPPASGARALITGDEIILIKPTATLEINITGQAGGS
jgi:hypothetical protein